MKKERNDCRKASSEALMIPSADRELDSRGRRVVARRAFLKGLGATGAVLLPASALLMSKAQAQMMSNAQALNKSDDSRGKLSKGDASILRFLAAAEILESDLWEQYWELASGELDFASTNPQPGTTLTATHGNKAYHDALQILDMDMPQYILDNTDDEFSHANFLLAYLKSKEANTSDLDRLVGPTFRTLTKQKNGTPISSQADGSTKKPRLTNLTQLTIDTSYFGRYRSDSKNPDLGDTSFAEPVPTLNAKGTQHTAIPRTNDDTTSQMGNLIKAIAFTAGWHFGFIEQGGTSLYPSLAQRVEDKEVLRIVLSIGPTETMHFQIWQEKAAGSNAGNPVPFTVSDPINNSTVTFTDLTVPDENLQANLIMPEPCPFLSRKFPICSIIRPTETKGAAMGAVKALTADGLFIGQTKEFFELLFDLATDADAAKREFEREK
ncbi:MAG TPA: twin-arginine translocation signal domain-containing protein [Chthoniobacterales bacterium]